MQCHVLISISMAGLWLLATCPVLGRQPPKEQPLTLHHDLGEIRAGKTYTAVFTIKNIFAEPFKVARVKKSCGCTNVELTSRNIAPGKTFEATVKAEITAPGYDVWEKSVLILDSSPNPKSIVLKISGSFPKDGRLFPEPNEIALGSIVQSVAVQRVLYLSRRDRTALLLESVEPSTPSILVEQSQGFSTEEGHGVFVVRVDPTTLHIGPLDERIYIKTKHPTCKDITVKISGRVVGDIYGIPKRLFLRNVPTGEQANWFVNLASFSGREFQIVGLDHTLGKDWTVVRNGTKIKLNHAARGADDNTRFVRGLIKITLQPLEVADRLQDLVIPVIGMFAAEPGGVQPIKGGAKHPHPNRHATRR